MSDITSLPVEFLCHIHATLNPPIVVPGGPQGTRVIVRVTGGTVTGPRINGTVEDLGADSLDIVELVMAFEEEFGVEVPDSDAEKLLTVGDVVKYIEDKQSK